MQWTLVGGLSAIRPIATMHIWCIAQGAMRLHKFAIAIPSSEKGQLVGTIVRQDMPRVRLKEKIRAG